MSRVETFTFRVNQDEKQIIKALAKRLQRSSSDAVRFVVKAAAKELGISTHCHSSIEATLEGNNDTQFANE